MTQNDTVTLTLSFSQPVTNLSLTITDIDRAEHRVDRPRVRQPRRAFTAVKRSQRDRQRAHGGQPFRSQVNGGISQQPRDVT